MSSRREFLQQLGSSVFYNSDDTITIEIGLYLTKYARDKYGSSRLNEHAIYIDELFQWTFGDSYDYYIGPHTIVEFEPLSTAQDTAESWRNSSHKSYKHSNILVLTRERTEWDNEGYAFYNHPYAVSNGYERVSKESFRLLVCHEIGHNLNARHSHGTEFENTITIMQNNTSKKRLNYFDEEAIDVMKQNL